MFHSDGCTPCVKDSAKRDLSVFRIALSLNKEVGIVVSSYLKNEAMSSSLCIIAISRENRRIGLISTFFSCQLQFLEADDLMIELGDFS